MKEGGLCMLMVEMFRCRGLVQNVVVITDDGVVKLAEFLQTQ
jgi:hypothetical protein